MGNLLISLYQYIPKYTIPGNLIKSLYQYASTKIFPIPFQWYIPEKAIMDYILLQVLIDEMPGTEFNRSFVALKLVSKEWCDSVNRIYGSIGTVPIGKVTSKIDKAKNFVQLLRYLGHFHKAPYLVMDFKLFPSSSINDRDLFNWNLYYKKACGMGIQKLGKHNIVKHVCFCYDGLSWHMGYYVAVFFNPYVLHHVVFFLVHNDIQNIVPLLCSIDRDQIFDKNFYTTNKATSWTNPDHIYRQCNNAINEGFDRLFK